MLNYVWPKDKPAIRARVLVALGLLIGAKVSGQWVPLIHAMDYVLVGVGLVLVFKGQTCISCYGQRLVAMSHIFLVMDQDIVCHGPGIGCHGPGIGCHGPGIGCHDQGLVVMGQGLVVMDQGLVVMIRDWLSWARDWLSWTRDWLSWIRDWLS